jgi:hypothetical protein
MVGSQLPLSLHVIICLYVSRGKRIFTMSVNLRSGMRSQALVRSLRFNPSKLHHFKSARHNQQRGLVSSSGQASRIETTPKKLLCER